MPAPTATRHQRPRPQPAGSGGGHRGTRGPPPGCLTPSRHGRPEAEHLRQTPRRVAAAYSELLTQGESELTTFENEEGYDQLVLARDMPFHSLCEHHMLPFLRVAHVSYLPSERIVALSKLARVV